MTINTYNLAGLSWNGFNVWGDKKSIEEVSRLVYFENTRGIRRSAVVQEEKYIDLQNPGKSKYEIKKEMPWRERWPEGNI
jgi:hypothetical protein